MKHLFFVGYTKTKLCVSVNITKGNINKILLMHIKKMSLSNHRVGFKALIKYYMLINENFQVEQEIKQ